MELTHIKKEPDIPHIKSSEGGLGQFNSPKTRQRTTSGMRSLENAPANAFATEGQLHAE